MTHEIRSPTGSRTSSTSSSCSRSGSRVSFFAGIMIADQLDAFNSAASRSASGSATRAPRSIFVLLIFVYVTLMNALDKKFGVYEA